MAKKKASCIRCFVVRRDFQQQAAYTTWFADLASPIPGGINATFAPDILKLGRLQVRVHDGTLIDTENANNQPPVLSLEHESHDVVVVLVLPVVAT